MMHVVICEDERCFQDALCAFIEKWKKSSNHPDVTCTCFSSSEKFLASWEKGLSADLLFLDIQIPNEMDGMMLAKKIRQRDQVVSIVFVTNYADYVYEGYSVNAIRYLKKPIQNEDIVACMDIAYLHFSLLSQEKLSVICRDQRLVLPFSEIIYVEIQLHYLVLTLHHSTEKPETRTRLHDFAMQLPERLFAQCHRSYIANLDHIRRFTKDNLTMSNKDQIPVSQTFATALRKKYDCYYMGSKG